MKANKNKRFDLLTIEFRIIGASEQLQQFNQISPTFSSQTSSQSTDSNWSQHSYYSLMNKHIKNYLEEAVDGLPNDPYQNDIVEQMMVDHLPLNQQVDKYLDEPLLIDNLLFNVDNIRRIVEEITQRISELSTYSRNDHDWWRNIRHNADQLFSEDFTY